MIFRGMTQSDYPKVEQLTKVCFPATHAGRAVNKLRKPRTSILEYSMIAELDGDIVGSIEFHYVSLPSGALIPMLGPVAVHPIYRSKGLGRALVEHGLHKVAGREDGILIVGVEDYYAIYGFQPTCTKNLMLDGDISPFVFMGLEFEDNIFSREKGLVVGV